MICSYGKDEPIKEMLQVPLLLPEYQFNLTGNATKLKIPCFQVSKNLKLTGYLNEPHYQELLENSDVIIVLTTRPDTVLNGAYEAVALEKPLITSDTEALRKHFYKGTIHTQNNAKAIAEAIKVATQHLNKLQSEISELRREKEEAWNSQFAIVQNLIEK